MIFGVDPARALIADKVPVPSGLLKQFAVTFR
jgi:hypothetical protein